jgi:hypothetical protein
MDLILSHIDTIVIALGIVGGWFWHKSRGDSTDSARTMISQLAKQIVHDTIGDLRDPAAEAKVRDYVTQKVSAWLTSHKITGVISDLLVREAVEIGITELKQMQTQQDALQDALTKLAAGMPTVDQLHDQWAKAEAEGRARMKNATESIAAEKAAEAKDSGSTTDNPPQGTKGAA